MEVEKNKKRKVMVAIDENENSYYALNWALDKLHDTIITSQLYLFTVQSVADLGFAYVSSYGAPRTSSTTPSLSSLFLFFLTYIYIYYHLYVISW